MLFATLIIIALYLLTGIISNILNIIQFCEERAGKNTYEEYKKKKLNG